ncbi:Dyp-type peroxidase [Novosphingobium profundi]|uniref:Dyp-type peroxidase n=1 Tax=Novosphingobium profundi TaxID=1774954 RepID=UPI001CFC59DB|nr:hypothetical protein [Novosphingobium profundi]
MAVDRDDVQALVRSGFGSLGSARYILVRIVDAARAKAWLRGLVPTRASEVGGGRALETVLQVAFTRTGLRALGFTAAELENMAPEFLDGMASDARRSHRLGDVGESAPAHWAWGTGAREPHVLLLLLAGPNRIADWASHVERDARANGFLLVTTLASNPGPEETGPAREPFGFADGLSQPEIDWDAKHRPSARADRAYRPHIAAGEVLLGHRNEYGAIAGDTTGPLVQRNGSYLVYRQLAQDVTGFWGCLRAAAGPDGAQELAERMVGRCIDGAPLPGLVHGRGLEDFDFQSDPLGLLCPLGAHIRRANPRVGDDPLGPLGILGNLLSTAGLLGNAAGDAVASARFHRLLRRGRPYGASMTPEQAMRPGQPETEAGLHFLCLNASLARQFEFVQGAWLISPTFGGLSQEGDPLIGDRCPFPDDRRTDLFRYHDAEGIPHIAQGMDRFVTVRGGAYFFLPGIEGLASITAR